MALGTAKENCMNANRDRDGEAADAACKAGIPKEGVAPNGESVEEPPPKRPLLPNVDEPKPLPEEAAPVAPLKPNAGMEDAPPNKLPPASALHMPDAVESATPEASIEEEKATGGSRELAEAPIEAEKTLRLHLRPLRPHPRRRWLAVVRISLPLESRHLRL